MTAYTFDDINIIPQYSEISSRTNCDVRTKISKNYSIDIPIVASPMDTICGKEMAIKLAYLGGIGFVHRFGTIEEQCAMYHDESEQEYVQVRHLNVKTLGAAIGVNGDWFERVQELVKTGFKILLIDVAHGHHINVKKALEKLKSSLPSDIDIIAGSIATGVGARDLIEWGADGIRCGIGNGSLCSTRMKTGVGIPQVSALLDCANICSLKNIPLIADGGIRHPADIAKALGIGAESVMIGSFLAGTDETPGDIFVSGELRYKKYRGSASRDAKIASGQADKHIEGESTHVPYKGPIEYIINDILDGLRSSMSYVGANNLYEFRRNVDFVNVTEAGRIEALPHLLLKR